ncbi:Neuropeptide-like peptide 36 family protein [Dictyocaulus viviparus]|uniref:Neuropeptide-like peptide 36 family protein n=1 Tax=Dictyocaulus viviparus TaxID=29172 RepID=A0A0D8Y835_DICVI|nr:Neuropeptide-like peptide 36 family protein [Dictyocaulus viviparus]
MSIDLKQELNVIDYFGALAVWMIFFLILFIVSVTCINWCCIQKHDDITVLEEWAYNHKLHMRMGPHRPSMVARNILQDSKTVNKN